MPVITQERLPIVFLLQGAGIPVPLVFGIPIVGIIKPEHYSFVRTARATVTHTLGSAFVDDFGEGPGQLTISGHTGWGAGMEPPGVLKLKLIEALFVEYEARRLRERAANRDANLVQLWLMDALNIEALSLFPVDFSLDRNRARPQLYFYRMRFIVLADLLQQAAYSMDIDSVVASVQNGIASAGSALTSLGAQFQTAAAA